jgi:hypothetical protein
MPNLTEESFHRLVDGDYTMEEACKVLPELKRTSEFDQGGYPATPTQGTQAPD